MINWQVRLKNRQFWVSVIPAIALVVQAILLCSVGLWISAI